MNRRHSPALLIGLVAVLMTVVTDAPALAQVPGAQSKLDLHTTNALQTATQPTLRVIVRVTPAGFDRLKSTIRQMMSAAGVPGSPLAHEILGAVTAQLALADIQRLALDPDVLRISSDALVRSSQAPALPAIDVEYVALHQQRDAIVAQAAAARTQTNQSYQAQLDAANAAAAAADAQYAATLGLPERHARAIAAGGGRHPGRGDGDRSRGGCAGPSGTSSARGSPRGSRRSRRTTTRRSPTPMPHTSPRPRPRTTPRRPRGRT